MYSRTVTRPHALTNLFLFIAVKCDFPTNAANDGFNYTVTRSEMKKTEVNAGKLFRGYNLKVAVFDHCKNILALKNYFVSLALMC